MSTFKDQATGQEKKVDPTVMFKAKERIGNSRARLLLQQPFYGVMLSMMDFIPETAIDTMATDGNKVYYSQQYGTVPIVRKTGGLADSVCDTLPETLKNNTATGFSFNEATPGALMEAIKRSLIVFSDSVVWAQLQINGMQIDYSWRKSAGDYLALYDKI